MMIIKMRPTMPATTTPMSVVEDRAAAPLEAEVSPEVLDVVAVVVVVVVVNTVVVVVVTVVVVVVVVVVAAHKRSLVAVGGDASTWLVAQVDTPRHSVPSEYVPGVQHTRFDSSEIAELLHVIPQHTAPRRRATMPQVAFQAPHSE